jgi:hypothetical protein
MPPRGLRRFFVGVRGYSVPRMNLAYLGYALYDAEGLGLSELPAPHVAKQALLLASMTHIYTLMAGLAS